MLFSKCRCLSSTSDPSAWYNRVQLNTFNQQKEINRLINESKGFSIQIKKLIQRIECLEKKVKQLEQKAQQQPRGNRGLTYIVQESAPVKADIATIKEKLKQAMEEGQRGQNKFSAIDANFDILVQAGDKLYQGLEKKIKELEDQLARKQKEDLDKLKKEIDQELKQEVDEKLKKKSNQIQKQASEIQHLQDVKGVLEREISNLKHAVAQNTEIKELEQQFKQIKKSQRQQLDATRAGVTTELENKLTTINQTVESKNLEYEKNLSDELKALRTELEEKIDQEAKERKLLQVTVDKTKKQVDDFDQKFIQAYNKQFQEIENLFEQKVDNDAKIKQLEGNINKIEEFQRELTTITGAVDASKDTTAQLAQIQQEVGEIKHLNDTSSKIVNEKVQQTVEKGTDAKIKVESEERSGEIKEKLDKSFEEIKRIQQKVDQINPLLDGKIIDKLGDLKNEIDTIKKQNNEITSLLKLNEKVNKIEEFQQQLTTITGAVDAIKEDTTAKLTNIQEKIDKSQKEVRKIQQEVEKIKNLNDTSSKTVSTKVQQTVDQEIPEYKNQLNKINELPSKLDQQINNINQLKGQYNDLKEEIDKIQKLISDIKEKELEQRVNQLENAIKDIANQKIEEIVNKIEADETQKLRNDLKSTLKSIYEISDSIKSICGIDGSNGIYTKLGEDLIKKLANVELKKNGVVLSSIDLKNCLINTLEEHIIRVLIKELVLAIEQLLLEDQPFQDLLKEQCELATKQLSNAVKNIVSDASQKELTKELIDKLRPRLFEEIECIDFSKRELLGKIYENLSEKLTQKIQSNLKESVEQKLEERNPIDSILEYSIKKVKVKIKNIIKKCKKKNCKKYDSCKGRQYYNSAI